MPEMTVSNPQATLVDLRLDAVALCETGANTRAHILLNKRKETKQMPTTFEELLKALTPEQAELINKHITVEQEAQGVIIKGLQDKIEALEKAKPVETPAVEDVTKGLPEEVQKKMNDMQTTINTLIAKQADEVAAKHFEKCKALPVEETALKDILKTASPAVIEVLEKAASALLEKTHTPAGNESDGQFSATDAASHYDVLEKSARKIMGEVEGLSFEQAFTKAIELDPSTYTKYVEGVK